MVDIKRKINIIGAIGDVHSEDRLLENAISFLNAQGVDMILCVGDVVDGRGNVDRCCDILDQDNIQVVQGNHDEWFINNNMRNLPNATQIDEVSRESIGFLQTLYPTETFLTDDGSLLLCHGLGDNSMAKVTPDDYGYALEANIDLQKILEGKKYRYIINGHTHKPMVRHFARVTIINAGTLQRDGRPGFQIVDFRERIVRYFTFNNSSIFEKEQVVSLVPE